MSCKITFSFLSESLTGDIGDDWRYSLNVKVFGAGDGSHARISQGTLEVPEHKLTPGTTQEPPGPPAPLVLSAGEAGGDIRVEMRFKAVEVDPVRNDTAETTASFKTSCPSKGAPAVVEERKISLGIDEAPVGLGTAILDLVYQVTLQSD